MRMPVLKTKRLEIRTLGEPDLRAVQNIRENGSEGCKEWLRWSELNYEQLARLSQPPYGDRAIVKRDTGKLIGLCGLVPSLIPSLPARPGESFGRRLQPEIGLFYEIAQEERRKGYASEAAEALVEWARDQLCVARIVGTTEFTNEASQAVLRRIGMTLLENDTREPPWFQVVGVRHFP